MAFTQQHSAVDSSRQLCQEARVVLTSLRGGPPHIARGELAQDLMELRDRIPMDLERHLNSTNAISATTSEDIPAAEKKDGDESADVAPSPLSEATVTTSFHASMDFSRPFLAVVTDPRASGPHTAVALQSIRRLLQYGSLPANEHMTRGVLACKFEQTNAGQDEAVEMAIADVLNLLLQIGARQMDPRTIHEALHTVFVTRSTFVNSPALVYHLEDVLVDMVGACQQTPQATRVVLEFLVHQLLNIPLAHMLSGSSIDSMMDESTREAQAANDATRVLCLRLVRMTLEPWQSTSLLPIAEDFNKLDEMVPLIQDDLCLSLLMTGQAIWHFGNTNHANGGNAAHLVSPAVLTEICATFTFLWNCPSLRKHLMGPMEVLWTGFYTRALALLRRRREAVNASAYHANLVFDAELEIILESLADLLHLHDHSQTIEADGGGASLEAMFVYYDCSLQRSDVAVGLYVELCRACGGLVNEDGQAVVSTSSGATSGQASVSSLDDVANDDASAASSTGDPTTSLVQVDHPWRPVPAHLKELCAAAIMGGMKCLFRDDKASPQKLMERASRTRNLTSSANAPNLEVGTDEAAPNLEEEDLSITTGRDHALRSVKSQKRFMRKAARIFNLKSSRGIEFLVDCGLLGDPITPLQVATYLRHAIVVGLDKAAVGSYLGEAGKSKETAPVWERDWFHKECLEAYCGLFSFQDQSLLDSLRMFLAAFRLPGEAQQIDRILQAFADKCAALCQEASTLFSKDPKKASDAAYLLSFSIIMLNTDQHNANIREDRKMTADDFVKNNTDYGRDITEPGKEFPREYLIAIYDSIREEEIRTEREGADGAMTVERWKDVLRQARASAEANPGEFHPSHADADDMTELVLEHVWKPILSAIGAFWNVSGRFPPAGAMVPDEAGAGDLPPSSSHGTGPGQINGSNHHAVMLGVQGARLGMDMSLEMLHGVRQLGRVDIFRKIFAWVCDYTGLLHGSTYANPELLSGVAVANSLVESVEAQSAVVVAIRTAVEAGEDLDVDGWKRFWAILFELRDAQVLPHFLLRESDADFLGADRRKEWILAVSEGDMTDVVADASAAIGDGKGKKTPSKPTSMFASFGLAIFGSDEPEEATPSPNANRSGKGESVIWDDLAPSDDEGEDEGDDAGATNDGVVDSPTRRDTLEAEFGDDIAHLSPGAIFEAQLIRESIDIDQHVDAPVTGLETAEETKQRSPRSRLRTRFRQACHLDGFIADSRFLDDDSIKHSLLALMDLIPSGTQQPVAGKPTEIDPSKFSIPAKNGFGRSVSDVSIATPSFVASSSWHVPVSPASEAFAEVVISEIAVKNRDRLKKFWPDVLQEHYVGRLTRLLNEPAPETSKGVIEPDPGLEKRITGLLRLSICSTLRGDMASEVIGCWKHILPMEGENQAQNAFKAFHRHLSEGFWRIVSNVDGIVTLNEYGWEGLLALAQWCAARSSTLPPVRADATPLAEDDPAIQTYRSLHMMLNASDIGKQVPCDVVDCLRTLIAAGDTRNYPQLSIASLDLIQLLNKGKLSAITDTAEQTELFSASGWRRIVDAMAEAGEHPRFSNVRQHALSMLTDLFLDKQNALVPIDHVCKALSEACVPLAGRCIVNMQTGRGAIPSNDEMMIEFDLCIGLIFKPLRHHLDNAVPSHVESHVYPLWTSVLTVLEEVLTVGSKGDETIAVPDSLRSTMHDLATEHLQQATALLISSGVLATDRDTDHEASSNTWKSVLRMGISQKALDSWIKKASAT